MINGSKHWTAHDDEAMHHWMGQYVEYLNTEHVMPERRSINNHGSYYDLQYVSVLRYAFDMVISRSAGQALFLHKDVPLQDAMVCHTFFAIAGTLVEQTRPGTTSTPMERNVSGFRWRFRSVSSQCCVCLQGPLLVGMLGHTDLLVSELVPRAL